MSEDKEKENMDPVDLASKEGVTRRSSGKNYSMWLFKFVLVIFILVAMGMCTIKYIS